MIDSIPCGRSLQLVATKQPIADPITDDLRDGRLVLTVRKKVSHDLLDRADRQPARQAPVTALNPCLLYTSDAADE